MYLAHGKLFYRKNLPNEEIQIHKNLIQFN
jgi:hypothetical protein